MMREVMTVTYIYNEHTGRWAKMISVEPIGGAKHEWERRVYSTVYLDVL